MGQKKIRVYDKITGVRKVKIDGDFIVGFDWQLDSFIQNDRNNFGALYHREIDYDKYRIEVKTK